MDHAKVLLRPPHILRQITLPMTHPHNRILPTIHPLVGLHPPLMARHLRTHRLCRRVGPPLIAHHQRQRQCGTIMTLEQVKPQTSHLNQRAPRYLDSLLCARGAFLFTLQVMNAKNV